MKNLKLVLSLVAVVLGLTSLSGCFPEVEEEALCENTCQFAFLLYPSDAADDLFCLALVVLRTML